MARRYGILLVLWCCLAAAGCSDDPTAEINVETPATLTVTSAAFEDGLAVPTRFTCDGYDQSPPLAWAGDGEEAAAWALVVDDPDAPGGTFVHWVVLDIPVETRSVRAGEVPFGAAQAVNSAGRASYTGPCPPSGTHRYRFSVYALSEPTGLDEGVRLDRALDSVGSLAVARGTILGTYQRRAS